MSARRMFTPEQKAEAIELYRTDGPTAVQERLGILKGTVTRWAQDAGVLTVSGAKNEAAIEAARQRADERKILLADGLLDDALRLREQLWAPCVERVVKTIGTGRGESVAEIVDVDLDQPSFGDKRQIMTTIAIAVDKVQLLTGAATERVETIGRDEVLGIIDELAARRRAS